LGVVVMIGLGVTVTMGLGVTTVLASDARDVETAVARGEASVKGTRAAARAAVKREKCMVE
jgi:hypothetical protein